MTPSLKIIQFSVDSQNILTMNYFKERFKLLNRTISSIRQEINENHSGWSYSGNLSLNQMRTNSFEMIPQLPCFLKEIKVKTKLTNRQRSQKRRYLLVILSSTQSHSLGRWVYSLNFKDNSKTAKLLNEVQSLRSQPLGSKHSKKLSMKKNKQKNTTFLKTLWWKLSKAITFCSLIWSEDKECQRKHGILIIIINIFINRRPSTRIVWQYLFWRCYVWWFSLSWIPVIKMR